ncbi:hypothetical protein ACFE04_031418 [Oxalis oulophora]
MQLMITWKLHLQWPLGYCQKPHSNCDPTIYKPCLFPIHGLWPTLADGNPMKIYLPRLIDGSFKHYDQTLLKNLGTYWPSLKYKDNKSFWIHEYNYHGVAALTEFKNRSENYFKKAVEMVFSKDIIKTIGVVIQGDNTTLQYSDVEAALDGLYEKRNYFLKCYRKGTDNVLSEVGVCYDKLGINNHFCSQKKSPGW